MASIKRRWQDFSLAGKIIGLVVSMVLAGTSLLTVFSIQRERANFRGELENQADLLLNAIALSAKDSLYYLRLDELLFIASELTLDPDVTSIAFFDSEGKILVEITPGGQTTFSQQVDPLGAALLQLSPSQTYNNWQDAQLLSGQSIWLGNQSIGAVSIGLSTEPLDVKLYTLTMQGIILAVLSIILGIGIAVLVVRQITNPLGELTHIATEMARGNTSIRANPVGNDEVGQVGLSFNKMAASIEEREKALRDSAAQLELTVAERTAKLRQQAAMMEKMAISDPLTRIFNRRHFFELSEVELERAIRYRHWLSVILFDADYFKNINDTFGHPFGDQMLIYLARLCEQNIRTVDIFARYGGEEFILLMPQTDRNAALITAERLRAVVENSPQLHDGRVTTLTISLGVACRSPEQKITLAELVEQADQALYRSKQAGRNQVTVFETVP